MDNETFTFIAHPVDWRYGSSEMRKILSVENLIKTYARIEATVAKVQSEYGVIPKDAADKIEEVAKNIDPFEVLNEEKKTRHDIVALINVISSKVGDYSRFIHYGLTSQDIKDTAFALIIKESLKLIEKKLIKLVQILVDHADKWRDLPCVGRTHGVHANIYSFGHKFAIYADEIMRHIERLNEGKKRFLVGKLSGAVGIHSVLGEKGLLIEETVMNKLGLHVSKFSNQVVPRDRYAEFFLILSMISSTLDKIATEIRNLHRTEIGEAEESFAIGQVGSSAMPHKKNPIDSENISGLSRILRSLSLATLENIVLWHERDLSNSSSERVLIVDYLLLLDEQLNRMIRVLENLKVNDKKILKNIELSRGTIFSEHLMYALIRKGIPRPIAHKYVQEISKKVYSLNQHLKEIALKDEFIRKYLSEEEINKIFEPKKYILVVPKLIEELKESFKKILEKYSLENENK